MQAGFTLDPNEKVLNTYHRHWIDLAPVVATTLTLVLLVVAGSYFYGRYHSDVSVPASVITLALLVIMLVAVGVLMLGIFIYRQNYMILTNMHLIQVEQLGLFNRNVSQLSLAKVQDVSAKRTGVLATILNFGNVEVQSAGEQEKFVFVNARDPQQIADKCLECHESYMGNTSAPVSDDV